MYILIPILGSIAGALLVDRQRESFGATASIPLSNPRTTQEATTTTAPFTTSVIQSASRPRLRTRFTPRWRATPKTSATKNAPHDTETDPVDPLEAAYQAIDQDLLIDQIGDDVVEDMGIGEMDQDLEDVPILEHVTERPEPKKKTTPSESMKGLTWGHYYGR